MLKDEAHLTIDTRDLTAGLGAMALKGEIAPFLEVFHPRVIAAMGVKDLRRLDEKALKLMLLAFISLSRIFFAVSEKEFAQGTAISFSASRASTPARSSRGCSSSSTCPPARRARRSRRPSRRPPRRWRGKPATSGSRRCSRRGRRSRRRNRHGGGHRHGRRCRDGGPRRARLPRD
jgi:hypothetical protein